ncbi:MAG: hypothetical protein EA425_12600 [Puniceicoccaceae bacterium]|nr:MAG: hypothetical protein EA425_12600 [Puniceicoccaceae bacterium]
MTPEPAPPAAAKRRPTALLPFMLGLLAVLTAIALSLLLERAPDGSSDLDLEEIPVPAAPALPPPQ